MFRTAMHSLVTVAWAAASICLMVGVASAQAPRPTSATPTIHGATPINGSAIVGEVGYAALRGGFYMGSADRDFGVELAAPTFGRRPTQGWGQSLGMDVRVPFRFLIVRWPKANGAFKVGPYFHVGRACYYRSSYYGGPRYDDPRFDDPRYRYNRSNCGVRNLGLGANLAFVTDIALPKLFKLIIGIEQQFGMLNTRNRDLNYGNSEFAAATWVDLGLEAFWRDMFFTTLINAGAQYGSNQLYWNNRALYRHMFGFGYKFK